MKFIIDAHLPPSLCNLFKEKGFDAIHTSQLPQKNATSDNQITELSMKEERIVITKDSDFWDSFVLKKEPHKLVLVKIGNSSTADLKAIFENCFDDLINSLKENEVIILQKGGIEFLDK